MDSPTFSLLLLPLPMPFLAPAFLYLLLFPPYFSSSVLASTSHPYTAPSPSNCHVPSLPSSLCNLCLLVPPLSSFLALLLLLLPLSCSPFCPLLFFYSLLPLQLLSPHSFCLHSIRNSCVSNVPQLRYVNRYGYGSRNWLIAIQNNHNNIKNSNNNNDKGDRIPARQTRLVLRAVCFVRNLKSCWHNNQSWAKDLDGNRHGDETNGERGKGGKGRGT